MIPQIGDHVAVTYLGRSTLGSVDATTDRGVLGVELDGEGRLAGLVLETDGGATYIPKAMVLRVEKEDLS